MSQQITLRDFNRLGYLSFRANEQQVLDAQGRTVKHASVNLRTGAWAVLVHWQEAGQDRREVAIMKAEDMLTVKGANDDNR